MSELHGMTRTVRKTPVNLFFLELIIVLLFFSVSGAVILNMFAKADILAEKTSLTERAVMNVQSIAEMYAKDGDMRGAAEKLFGRGWYTDNVNGGITVCLDEDMKAILTEDIRRQNGRVSILLSEERTQGQCGEFCELTAKVLLLADGGKVIYTQTSSAYIPSFSAGNGGAV